MKCVISLSLSVSLSLSLFLILYILSGPSIKSITINVIEEKVYVYDCMIVIVSKCVERSMANHCLHIDVNNFHLKTNISGHNDNICFNSNRDHHKLI